MYDRQIRLWGVSSQAKLKISSVLIFGLSRVNIEIAKNLVLAGTNIILHSESLEESENMLTLLEPHSDVSSVILRTAEALRTLNPMATVLVGDQGGVEAVAVIDWRSWSLLPPESRKRFRGKVVVTLEISEGTLSVLDFDNHEISEETKANKALPLPGRVRSPAVDEVIAASSGRLRRRKEPVLVEKAFEIMRTRGTAGEVDFALAAVTGGLLAQEAVKKITGKDIPLMNTLCVEENSMGAYVAAVGVGVGVEFLGQEEEDVEIIAQSGFSLGADIEIL